MASPKFAPFITLLTPNTIGHELVTDLVVHLAEAQHSVALLTTLIPLATDRTALDAAVPSYLVWQDKTPVHIRYGSSVADTYDWYGYIASHQVLHGSGSTRKTKFPIVPVQYTLTGASMVMQQAQSRTFVPQSASAIARQVITADRFTAAVSTHPRILPGSTQAGVSDFTYLAGLAQQVGWRLWADNGLIYFLDPALAVIPASSAPVFTSNAVPGIRDTLTNFTSTVGETDPSGGTLTSRTAYTMRTSSRQVVQASTTPVRQLSGQSIAPQFTSVVQQPAASYTEAAYVTAAAAAASKFWVSATASCDGNTQLRPGRLMSVTGPGLRSVDQGLWRISAAEHHICLSPLLARHNTYSATVTLGRDQEASLTVINPRVALPTSGAMTLLNGTWVSA